MRALRVVGVGEDGTVVLEDPVRHERFSVVADEQLRAAARGDLTRLGQIEIESQSPLRPRDIQARIRAGASVDQVASAGGVLRERIERFAHPVLLERSRVAELAQAAHPVDVEGADVATLGEIVAHTFADRGQDHLDAEWDAWKGDDGSWVVALSWRAGRSDNRAHWTFRPGPLGGTVTARDEQAGDLVEGLPARPLRTIGPVLDLGRSEDEDGATATGAGPERSATPSAAPTGPAPAGTGHPVPVKTGPAEPGGDTGAGSGPRRNRKGKATVPSWDEVLLGVRGNR